MLSYGCFCSYLFAHTASSRLHELVAAALAIGSLSLCAIVTLTVFSIKVSMAMPVPA